MRAGNGVVELLRLPLLKQVLGKVQGYVQDYLHRSPSRSLAKERLKFVLIHDQASLSPGLLETLKEEVIQVISKYLEIDRSGLEVGLTRREGSVVLAASIPVVRLRRKAASGGEPLSRESGSSRGSVISGNGSDGQRSGTDGQGSSTGGSRAETQDSSVHTSPQVTRSARSHHSFSRRRRRSR